MQKTFRLLPFSYHLCALSFLLLAFPSSCHLNPDVQKPGEGYLQGEWQQDSIANQKQLLSYSLYHLKFSCDSFYVTIQSFSKVNTGADSCMVPGHWIEYCRGTYEQRRDTLQLKGQFCNPDFTIKDDKGCFRSGDYDETFKLHKKRGSLVQFASTTNVIPINAHLVKRISCHPKPI